MVTGFKQRILTENFLKDIDRNVLRPKQYKQYKEALQAHHSAAKQYNNEYNAQLETYNKYKNSPNAPDMLKQLEATKNQLDYHAGMVDHLQTYDLQALKYNPQEMEVKKARTSGLKTGALAGGALGLGAGLATHLLGGEASPVSESAELQEGVLRDVSNGLQSAALMGGLTAAGAIAGHAMEDNVQDAVSDGFEKLEDVASNGIEQKVAAGQQLTPDEQKLYDTKQDNMFGKLNYFAANKIGAEQAGSNIAQHSTLTGAGLGALMAARLNQAANKKQ